MPTPFPTNAVLTFQAFDQVPAINEFGNPAGTTSDAIAYCYLRRVSGQGKASDSLQGGNVARVDLEGRIDRVEFGGNILDALPAAIASGTMSQATISDPAGVATAVTGQFYLEPSPPSALGTSAALGAPIRGYLLTEVAWAEAL